MESKCSLGSQCQTAFRLFLVLRSVHKLMCCKVLGNRGHVFGRRRKVQTTDSTRVQYSAVHGELPPHLV